MSWTRRHRKLASWMTLVILVLATLAPGVARALAFAQGAQSPADHQVCSASTDPRSALGGLSSRPAVDQPAGQAHADCPFCLLRGDLSAPPPSTTLTLPAAAAVASVPRLFLQSPRPLFAWSSAQPRGPPGRS
jgi:hypothetical protein